MVNEHLDVESHWLRHLLCFKWQHNRDRGKRKQQTRRNWRGRQGYNILNKGRRREGRKRRSKRPAKAFDIIL